MSFSVSTSIRLERRTLERILRLPGGIVDRNMRRRVARALEVAQRTAPGRMGQSLSASYRYTAAEGPVGTITNRHPAAIYVVNGTRPHIIRPVRAQALRFTIGGRTVFAKIVHHPGTQPNSFMVDALRSAV